MKGLVFIVLFLAMAMSVSAYRLGTLIDLSNTDPLDWVGTSTVYSTTYDGNDKIYTTHASGKFGVYNITDGVWYDLSATDIGDWVGTSTVFASTYDNNSNMIYTGLQGGKFGVYNISDGVWYDLSLSDPGDWVGISAVQQFLKVGNNIYTSIVSGKFGVYNISDGIWYDLSATDIGDWVSTSIVYSLAYDGNDKIYTGLQGGKFGVYNISDGVWYDLSATDIGDWVGTSFVSASTYDNNSNMIYTGLASGKFGVYNISDGVWYDLSGTDIGNWVGTSNVNSVLYDYDKNLIFTGLASGKFGVYNPEHNVWYDLSDTDFNNWVGTSTFFYMVKYGDDLIFTGLSEGKLGLYNPDLCWENWRAINSACINDSYIKYYNDTHYCGTYNDLPLDNGTVLSCVVTGNGSIDNPYNISNIYNLETFGRIDACGYWQLVNDLDLSGWGMTEKINTATNLPIMNISTNCSQIYFDGKGYKMYGLNNILFGDMRILNTPATFNRVWLEFDIVSELNSQGSFAYRVLGNASNYVVFNNSYFKGTILNTNPSQTASGGLFSMISTVIFDNITTNITVRGLYANGLGHSAGNTKVLNSNINNILTAGATTNGGLFNQLSTGGAVNNIILNTVIRTTQYNFGTSGGIVGSSTGAYTLNNLSVYVYSYNASSSSAGIANGFTGTMNNIYVYMRSYNSTHTVNEIMGTGSTTNANVSNVYVDFALYVNRNTSSTTALQSGLFGSVGGQSNFVNITAYSSGTGWLNASCAYGGIILFSQTTAIITIDKVKIYPNYTLACKPTASVAYWGGIVRITPTTGKINITNSFVKGDFIISDVSGITNIKVLGGLVGDVALTTGTLYINNSYFIGNLSGNYTGGLIGKGGTTGTVIVANSYAVPYLNYVTTPTIGLIGNGTRSFISSFYDSEIALFDDGLYNRSTTEMKTQSTFTNWDFNETWQLCAGEYPSLRGLDAPCVFVVYPDSVANLSNVSASNDSIYWSWSNPVLFNYTILYLDGVNFVNSTGSFYNVTGLVSNTSYTLTVHTVLDGVVNDTNVSSSAWTLENVFVVVDSVVPLINFTDPTVLNGSVVSDRAFFDVRVVASDVNLAGLSLFVYDGNYNLVQNFSSVLGVVSQRITVSANGVYYFNASACDSYGNCNATELRTVSVLGVGYSEAIGGTGGRSGAILSECVSPYYWNGVSCVKQDVGTNAEVVVSLLSVDNVLNLEDNPVLVYNVSYFKDNVLSSATMHYADILDSNGSVVKTVELSVLSAGVYGFSNDFTEFSEQTYTVRNVLDGSQGLITANVVAYPPILGLIYDDGALSVSKVVVVVILFCFVTFLSVIGFSGLFKK